MIRLLSLALVALLSLAGVANAQGCDDPPKPEQAAGRPAHDLARALGTRSARHFFSSNLSAAPFMQ